MKLADIKCLVVVLIFLLTNTLSAQQIDNVFEAPSTQYSSGFLSGSVQMCQSQSFTMGPVGIVSETITITFLMGQANAGNNHDFSVNIYYDNAGIPGFSLIKLAGNTSPEMGGLYSYTGVVTLAANATYHIVTSAPTSLQGYVHRATSSTNFNANHGFLVPSGVIHSTDGGSTWSAPSADYFRFRLNIPMLLPVELMNFEASVIENETHLEWATATELNNDFFEIEHSTNGTTFSTIGKINGAGSSSEEQSYDFRHTEPQTGVNYYRLRQVDFNGEYEYSDIVSIQHDKISDDVALHVYPNPVTTKTQIILNAHSENSWEVEVLDSNGRLMKKQSYHLSMGEHQLDVNMDDLSTGRYVLRCYNNATVLTESLIISK